MQGVYIKSAVQMSEVSIYMILNVIISENDTERKSLYTKFNVSKHRALWSTRNKLVRLTLDILYR